MMKIIINKIAKNINSNINPKIQQLSLIDAFYLF